MYKQAGKLSTQPDHLSFPLFVRFVTWSLKCLLSAESNHLYQWKKVNWQQNNQISQTFDGKAFYWVCDKRENLKKINPHFTNVKNARIFV